MLFPDLKVATTVPRIEYLRAETAIYKKGPELHANGIVTNNGLGIICALDMLDSKIRIYFELDPEEWHGGGTEGIWAEPVEGSESGDVYRLLNSPFYAIGVSYLDIVRAVQRTDGEPGLQFLSVIDTSGHSTYMIMTPVNRPGFDEFWARLENLGCSYESSTSGDKVLYSVDVPATTDADAVYRILEEGESYDIWEFQEGHCGHPLKNE